MHPQRLEDALGREAVERQPAHTLHDLAQQHEVEVAVDEPLAGRRDGALVIRALQRHCASVELLLQIEIGPQAGDVREQLLDGDPLLAALREVR